MTKLIEDSEMEWAKSMERRKVYGTDCYWRIFLWDFITRNGNLAKYPLLIKLCTIIRKMLICAIQLLQPLCIDP